MRIVQSLVIAETSSNRGVSPVLVCASSSTRALLDLLRLQARLENPEKAGRYERAIAASMFESTPSCAKITVPEG